LEDIIGGDKHRLRDRDIWRIRCFAVDDELEFGGLFDRKIRWLDISENLVDGNNLRSEMSSGRRLGFSDAQA
jgi:hypothetical protein